MATKQLIEELTYQRDMWKADCLKLEAEVERLRAALEKIARYEYRGGKTAPTTYPDITYPSAAEIASRALAGEE